MIIPAQADQEHRGKAILVAQGEQVHSAQVAGAAGPRRQAARVVKAIHRQAARAAMALMLTHLGLLQQALDRVDITLAAGAVEALQTLAHRELQRLD